MEKKFSGQKISDNPEGILRDIFYLAAVLPFIANDRFLYEPIGLPIQQFTLSAIQS